MKRVSFAAILAVLCLLGNLGAAPPPKTIDDETIRRVLLQARDLINADKLDEAIRLLEPLAPIAGDRLVYLPPGPSYVLPPGAPAPPPVPVSVVQYLGGAYWGKRDAAKALPYLEIVAARIPPDQDSLILGTVLECRRILARQALSLIGARSKSTVVEPLTLSIEADKTNCERGEPILIAVIADNLSSKTVETVFAPGFTNPPPLGLLTFEVVNTSGQVLPYEGELARTVPPGMWPKYRVPPGASLIEVVNLLDAYNLRKPDVYRLRATCRMPFPRNPADPDSSFPYALPTEVTSNELTITVLPGSDTSRQPRRPTGMRVRGQYMELGGPRLTGVSEHARALEAARYRVRRAHEANERGDHAEAVRVAKQVLSEMGNVIVRWPGEGAVHPAPEADIYDVDAFVDAQTMAAAKTGTQVNIQIRGAGAREELLDGYYGLKDWPATAQLAEEILREVPDADVAWSMRLVALKHLAVKVSPLTPAVFLVADNGHYQIFQVTGDGASVSVGLRAFCAVPGARLDWDESRQTATLAIGQGTYEFRAGSRVLVANGRNVRLPTAPQLRDGRMWVSLESLESAGLRVERSPEARLVVITLAGG